MTSKFLSILAILTLFAAPNYAIAGDHGAADENHAPADGHGTPDHEKEAHMKMMIVLL